MKLALGALLLLSVAAGCSGNRIESFSGTTPQFEVEKYFLGRTTAHGVFYDWHGRFSRHFVVSLDGTQEGDKFILREDFVFNDGETQQRVWEIQRRGEHEYRGTSEDVIGVAFGEREGKALHWKYRLNLKTGSGKTPVSFDDWLFLLDDTHVFNRAQITKFGVQVGEVLIFFSKEKNV